VAFLTVKSCASARSTINWLDEAAGLADRIPV
jgi:hypothetical protein